MGASWSVKVALADDATVAQTHLSDETWLPGTSGWRILDGFEYSWSHKDGQIPGSLDPARVSMTFAAPSYADLPPINIGTRWKITLKVGGTATANNVVHREFNITDVSLSFDPNRPYPAEAKIIFTDLLAKLRATNSGALRLLTAHRAKAAWYDLLNIAESVALHAIASSVYTLVPAMSTGETWAGRPRVLDGFRNASTTEGLASALASSPMRDRHWSAFPSSYHATEQPYPYAWGEVWYATIAADIAQKLGIDTPASGEPEYLQLLPHDRKVLGRVEALYTLSLSAGSYRLTRRTPEYASHSEILLLDACKVQVPASAVFSRAHTVTVLEVEGGVLDDDTTPNSPWRDRLGVTSIASPYASMYGINSAAVETDIATARDDRGGRDENTGRISNATAAAASMMQPSHSHAPDMMVFDDFTVRGNQFDSQAEAFRVFKRLTPSQYVDGSEPGGAVCPVVIFDIDPDLGIPSDEVRGFASAGQINISNGEITYQLSLTPGSAQIADQSWDLPSLVISGIVTYNTLAGVMTYANTDATIDCFQLLLTKV